MIQVWLRLSRTASNTSTLVVVLPSLLAFSILRSYSLQEASKVTYQTVAKPLADVLTDLTKLTGQHLRAQGPYSSEPVIVSVHDAPLAELLPNFPVVVQTQK